MSSALAFAQMGQVLAESLMTDLVTITRDGPLATNPTTGEVSLTQSTLYSGKAQIRPETTSEADRQAAGEAVDLLDQYLVKVPVAFTAARVDDTVTVTASADPAMVGVAMRVIGVVRGTAVTARRLRCRIDANSGGMQ